MNKSLQKTNTNVRQSNIETLRIIAMIMIIAHHFVVHGGFDFPAGSISTNKLWLNFIEIGGKIGVDLFVLISGYFLVASQSLKISKVVKLWLQVFFYSVGIYIVFVLMGQTSFSVRELIKSFLPITLNQWWFACTYFILYLLTPFINLMLNQFNKKQYLSFCYCSHGKRLP